MNCEYCVPVSRCGLERVNARASCLSAITVFVVGSHLNGGPRPEPPGSVSGAVTAVVFFGEETARVGRGGDGLVFRVGVSGHVVASGEGAVPKDLKVIAFYRRLRRVFSSVLRIFELRCFFVLPLFGSSSPFFFSCRCFVANQLDLRYENLFCVLLSSEKKRIMFCNFSQCTSTKCFRYTQDGY